MVKNNTQPKRAKRTRKLTIQHPPQFNSNVEITRKFRFNTQYGNAVQVTSSSLLQALGIANASSTVGYCVAKQVKINNIEMWGPQSSTISIVFSDNVGLPSYSREISDTSMASDHVSHITVKPPPQSVVSMYNKEGVNLFTAQATQSNGIIDISVTYVLHDGTKGTAVTLTSGTTGNLTYAPLDGVGGVYKAIGLVEAV